MINHSIYMENVDLSFSKGEFLRSSFTHINQLHMCLLNILDWKDCVSINKIIVGTTTGRQILISKQWRIPRSQNKFRAILKKLYTEKVCEFLRFYTPDDITQNFSSEVDYFLCHISHNLTLPKTNIDSLYKEIKTTFDHSSYSDFAVYNLKQCKGIEDPDSINIGRLCRGNSKCINCVVSQVKESINKNLEIIFFFDFSSEQKETLQTWTNGIRSAIVNISPYEQQVFTLISTVICHLVTLRY